MELRFHNMESRLYILVVRFLESRLYILEWFYTLESYSNAMESRQSGLLFLNYKILSSYKNIVLRKLV